MTKGIIAADADDQMAGILREPFNLPRDAAGDGTVDGVERCGRRSRSWRTTSAPPET
jgi:predicted metalloprotease